MAKRNPYLKKAGVLDEYTADQMHELVRCATDPLYFVDNYCKIVHPILGVVPFTLHGYQRNLIHSYHTATNSIILSPRQTGKSTTASAFLLWFAIFHENKHILIVSNRNSGSMEMITRIEFMYEHLPHWLKPAIDAEHWNMHSKWFSNGSKLDSEATTPQSGRGLSISLLFCDEFAHVDQNVAELFWTAISPTLATGGKALIASTPNGDSNLYAQLWRGALAGTNGFNPIEIKWDEPPGRDEIFKQEQIGKIGLLKWSQEYECVFISSDPLLINSLFLSTYPEEELPEVDARGIVWFSKTDSKKSYIIGIDPATGSGSDFTVISIFSFPDLEQVAEFRSNTTSSATVYTTFKYIMKKLIHEGITNIYFSVENNGVGEGFIGIYQMDDDSPEVGEFISEEGKNRAGMNTSGKSKSKACINFKNLFESGRLKVRSKNAINEMKHYVRSAGSYGARRGATDDCIASLLIVVRILDELVQYEDNVYEVLYDTGLVNEFDTESKNGDDAPVPMLLGVGSGFSESRYANYKIGKFHDINNPDSFDPWGDNYPFLG